MKATALVIDLKEAELVSAIERYKEIKGMISERQKEEKALKSHLIENMTDNKLTAGSYTAVLKTTTVNGLDTDTLKKELPELWTEYGKTTERNTLIIA